MKKQFQGGMTLIELMIVVAIIGIIAAVVAPMYSNYIKTSHMKEAKVALRSLETAQEEFRLSTGAYFSGGTADQLMANSGELWDINEPQLSATENNAKRLFDYQVVAGTTGDLSTSFEAKATGKNGTDADGSTCTLRSGEEMTCN